LKFRITKLKRKSDGEKEVKGRSFSDLMKAKARLNLYEKRLKMIQSLIAGAKENEELDVSKLLKLQIIATQGLGEVGDTARIHNDAVEGLQELFEMAMLDELEYGKGNEINKVDSTLIFGALVNLLNRSIRREHTDVEIVDITDLLLSMSGYMQRAGRTSSLSLEE